MYQEGLLSIADYKDKMSPVSSYPVQSNLLTPNLICEKLWQWLIKHLESRVLVEWVLNNGTCLHPRLKENISSQIEYRGGCKEPYLTFWRIITSGNIKCSSSSDSDGYMIVQRLKKHDDALALRELCKAIEPKIILG